MKTLLRFSLLLLALVLAPLLTVAQDFYFLVGIIQDSQKNSITLEIRNFTGRTIKVHPKLSVMMRQDSIWLTDPGQVITFEPGGSFTFTFTNDTGVETDMSDFKSKFVSVLYTITPHYSLQNEQVVATKPIDGQYLRLDLPLPVTWLSFNAKKDGLYNRLEWVTASEINSDLFHVERSVDGIGFTEVGRVKSAGTTSVVSTYEFRDYLPGGKSAYYRLKQVDFDGKYEYSKTVYAGGTKGGEYFGFTLTDGEIPKVLKAYDITGKLIRVWPVGVNISLPDGMAVLVLETDKRNHSRKVFTSK